MPVDSDPLTSATSPTIVPPKQRVSATPHPTPLVFAPQPLAACRACSTAASQESAGSRPRRNASGSLPAAAASSSRNDSGKKTSYELPTLRQKPSRTCAVVSSTHSTSWLSPRR